MELLCNISAKIAIWIFVTIIMVAVLFSAYLLIESAISKIRAKIKSKKKPKPITAVLYDSKVEQIVDMIYINKPVSVLYKPVFVETKIEPILEICSISFDELKSIRYHFFCIQDDGKHIFIERP